MLWVLLIAVPITLVYVRLHQEADGGGTIHLQWGRFSRVVSRKQFLTFATEMATSSKAHLIEAVNLPAFAVGILVSRVSSSWPMSWTPQGLLPEQWNALSFPFYCLPFWWFVGRGFDALLSRERLRWPSLLLGTLLCGFFLFLMLGLRFGISAEERKGLTYPFWGFGLWVALFSVFPVTWARQKGRRREGR